MTRYPRAYRLGLHIGRTAAAVRRAWSWLECGERRLEQPPAGTTVLDRYGRRWALWKDGRWVTVLDLPSTTRLDLLAALNGCAVDAGSIRRGLGVVRDWPQSGSVAGSLPDLLDTCLCRWQHGAVDPDCPVHGGTR
jgi:hypothetical protein